eukprot:2969192-Pleurochrysis_carterae.AAC.2
MSLSSWTALSGVWEGTGVYVLSSWWPSRSIQEGTSPSSSPPRGRANQKGRGRHHPSSGQKA